MLEGEDRRGREHRDLLVVGDSFESGAHGDFCLSVADVAAEQAIHGLSRFHIAFHVGDGEVLVVSFAVLESVFEFAHPFVVGREGVTFRSFSFGVKLEQFVRHVFHGFADAGFGFRPGRRAQMT